MVHKTFAIYRQGYNSFRFFLISKYYPLDRDAKKSKFSDCLAEFSVYFNGKSKNFLLKKFSKIFQNGGAMHGDIYVVKTSIF